MSFLKLNKPEISVLLKCQICGTFITSPSLPVIKKHLDKHLQNKHATNFHFSKLPEENELFDMECDLIDDEMESVTFSQPFVLLDRCKLEVYSEDRCQANQHCKEKRRKTVVNKKKEETYQHSIPVSSCSNEFSSTVTSKRTPRKSRLKALEKLSKVRELESKINQGFDSSDNDSDEWGSESESKEDVNDEHNANEICKPAKKAKQEQRKYALKLCCAYDNPNYPFKCDCCTARFTTEIRLIWHKQKVHGSQNKDVYSCSICGRMFHNRYYFQNHLNCHQDAEETECEFNLWKKWPKPPKKNNGKSKNQKLVFNCKYCLMPHCSNSGFVTHMTSNHSDKGQHSTFQCPYTCSVQTNSIKQLISHLKTDHFEDYQGKSITYEDGKPKQKCDVCGKLFDIHYMANHKALHVSSPKVQSDGIYTCPYPNCQIRCKQVRYLKNHFTLHLQNNPYICIFPGCAKVDNFDHLKRHIQRHLDAPLTCSKCGVSSSTSEQMKSHPCQTNIEKQAKGECKLVKVGKSWSLRASGAASSSGNCVTKSVSIIKDGSPEEYSRYIKSLQKLDRNEVMKRDPVFIQACKDSPGFGNLLLGALYFNSFRGDQNKIKVKSFKCPKCPTVIAGKHGFTEHKKHCGGSADQNVKEEKHSTDITLGEKELNLHIGCPVCGKSFPGSDSLNDHFNDEHGPYKSLQCEEPDCGQYFANADSKQRHFLCYHMHKPYPCAKCDKSFTTESKLNYHLKLHRLNPHMGAPKTAPCELCGIVLINIYSLNRHKKLVHGITAPVPLSGRKSGTNEHRIIVKIEPELHILPNTTKLSDSDNHVVKHECGKIFNCETKDSTLLENKV